MKRTLLDTSVYGELIKNTDTADKLAKLVPAKYVIYGTKFIRDELRATSKAARIEGKSKRSLLLRVYDTLVKKDHHTLEPTPIIDVIAGEFYRHYRKNGGSKSLKDMVTDFRIVAVGAFYSLDIVVSNDEKSMLSDTAIAAYKEVCSDFGMEVPDFLLYRRFKEMIIRG